MRKTLIGLVVVVFSLSATGFCKSPDSLGATCGDSDKIFAPVAGRYGINPSIAFSHGGGTSTLSISLAGESFIVDQLSFLASLGVSYATSSGASATSVLFMAGPRFYIFKEGRAIPYVQASAGLMHISSGGASATAGLVSPGVGLMVPINSYVTVNVDIDPAVVFNSGAKFYIFTSVGLGFWF